MSRDTEIYDFNDKLVLVARNTPAQVINQQVLWLNVTMHNLSLMAMSDGWEQLCHDFGSLILTEGLLLKDRLEELTAWTKLLDNVEILIVLKELIELDDVRVIDDFHNGDLILNHL